jgi:hypothetical protein
VTSPSIRLLGLLVEESYHDLTDLIEDHGNNDDLLQRLDNNASIY